MMPDPDEGMDRLYWAIEEYPHRAGELRAQVAQAMGSRVTGTAGDGKVVVTLSVGGEVQSVRVGERALRDVDNHTLADLVRTAVNDALDAADAAVALPGEDDLDARQEQTMAEFERRMDGLLDRLDAVDRGLDRLDG
jgi:DNA-binding protein YbaB